MEVFLLCLMILSTYDSTMRGGRGNIVQNGDEYVVNKRDVVEYTKTIRKYCGVRDL